MINCKLLVVLFSTICIGTAAAGEAKIVAGAQGRATELEKNFATPPAAAKPWVYCFWLEGNVTREGITADLEAMQRAGIGGLLFMDGDMGNPKGPHRFMSESWRAMFKHMVAEANRLGLEINLNNDPGWAGSGGPWVKPEQATQKVVASETTVQGPAHFDARLAQPPTKKDFYGDIIVLACPAPVTDAARVPSVYGDSCARLKDRVHDPHDPPRAARSCVAASRSRWPDATADCASFRKFASAPGAA